MKRAYQKPTMYVENFALSQAIAEDCGFVRGEEGTLGKPGFRDQQTCGWDLGGSIYWTNQHANCNWDPKTDEIDAGCYNNPTSMNALFAYS